MYFQRDASTRKTSGGDKTTPRMPLREERLTVKPSTFKGEAIKGGTQRQLKCYICNNPYLIRDFS